VKRITGLLFTIISFLYASSATVYAQTLCPPGTFSNLCKLNIQNSGSSVVQLILILAIILSLFFLIWGGIRYISSGGDKGKVVQARSTLTAAIVGLVISLLAYFIVGLILYFLTGKGLSSMSIPTLLQ